MEANNVTGNDTEQMLFYKLFRTQLEVEMTTAPCQDESGYHGLSQILTHDVSEDKSSKPAMAK
jgi:hypothetical protein